MKKLIVLGCYPHHQQYCTVLNRNYDWFYRTANEIVEATQEFKANDFFAISTTILANKELWSQVKIMYGYILTVFTQGVGALRESELEGLELASFHRAIYKRTGMMPLSQGKTVGLGRRSELMIPEGELRLILMFYDQHLRHIFSAKHLLPGSDFVHLLFPPLNDYNLPLVPKDEPAKFNRLGLSFSEFWIKREDCKFTLQTNRKMVETLTEMLVTDPEKRKYVSIVMQHAKATVDKQ
jgi:hypothetical protein